MKIIDLKGPKARAVLLAATAGVLVAGGGIVVAQARHAPRDPATLPEFRGQVAQYDLTPRGDVDGLILADGTEVHFPPHLGPAVQAAVRPGDAVTIRGERSGPVLRAGSVANAAGDTVVDRGPPPGGPRPGGGPGGAPGAGAAREPMEETGTVKMALHGPRGDLNGVLLQSGTVVRLPPKEAARLADMLKPGLPLAVRGRGIAGAAGRVVGAEAIGPSPDKLTQLSVPPPPPEGPAGGPGAPRPGDAKPAPKAG